jgi:RNA polymerase sigma-54 factor
LQLKALPGDTPGHALAATIIQSCLNLLAAKDFAQIKRKTGSNDQQLALAVQLVTSLDPRPGSRFSQVDSHYITPDVIVRLSRGRWRAMINPQVVPKVRINDMYAQVLRAQKTTSTLHTQLQEARWVVQNIEQRFATILAVSQAIVDRQKDFFTHGEMAMQPLVLREIANEIGMHESTISRVSNQKYLASPQGVFELKYFFSSHIATSEGGQCSATAIRALIKKLVEKEDPQKPLSDAKIAELLEKEGMIVARRTIAKYRDYLHIPPASQRKKLL